MAKRGWIGALVAGLVAFGAPAVAAAEAITSARYEAPTTRYPHGALGDPVEHAALRVSTDQGRALVLTWPDGMVFEDTAPRLADMDGDGAPEVITVESSARFGARLAIYGLKDGQLSLRAATPHIGQSNRWLSVVGAADLDGDGRMEVAYVDRPHLAKILRVWRLTGDELAEVATLSGLTNHRYGEADIWGGIAQCGGDTAIITADAGWQNVMATRLNGDYLVTEIISPFGGAADLNPAKACALIGK